MGAWLHRLRDHPGRFGGLPAAAAVAQAAQRDAALLERRAGERLAHVLATARTRTLYAAVADHPGATGLSSFPVLEKTQLHAAASALIREAPDDVEVTTTSGTSGRVTQLVRPRDSNLERAAIDRRLYDALGLPAFFEFVIVVPWRDPGAARWGLHDWRIRCRQMALGEVARSVERGQPVGDLLISVPRLCRQLSDWGLGSSRALVAGFELADGTRAQLLDHKAAADAAPAEIYSASELCSTIAFRFPDCPRLHVNADAVHLEVLYPGSIEPVQRDAGGEIVVTDLLNDAMPLIRYRLGDLGAVDERRCPCGRVTPTIRLLGRTSAVGNAAAGLLARTDLGVNAGEMMLQTARDEVLLCGASRARNELARRVADSLAMRVLDRGEVPAPLAPLARHFRIVSIAERIPSDRAEGRTLLEMQEELDFHDPRLEADP